MVALTQYQFNGRNAGREWREIIVQLFGVGDSNVGEDETFYGHLKYCRLGNVELSRVMTSREWARRTHSHVSSNDQDIYNLVQVLRGSISLRHGAHEFRLGPQSFVLFCVTRPYEWDHADVAEVRNFAIPGSILRARLRDLDRFTNRAFQQPNGSWAVLFDMIGSSFRHADKVPDPAAHRIASQLVDLLTLSLEAGDELSLGTPEIRRAAYQCCVNFIRGNISDLDLDPDSVAKAVGVSVRSLHRLFAAHGPTVCDLIREERLSTCFKALQDPGLEHFCIAEIAYRHGFRSQAHFANAFKAKFGVTAKACRQISQRTIEN